MERKCDADYVNTCKKDLLFSVLAVDVDTGATTDDVNATADVTEAYTTEEVTAEREMTTAGGWYI